MEGLIRPVSSPGARVSGQQWFENENRGAGTLVD